VTSGFDHLPAARGVFTRRPVIATADRDDARRILSEVYLPLDVEPALGSKLNVQLNAVEVGRVTAGYLRFGDPVRIRTAEAENYHVDIPMVGSTLARAGLKPPVYSTPKLASVFTPDVPAELEWGQDCAQVCLMLPREELQLELENLLGHPVRDRLDFTPALDLTSAAAGTLLATLRLIDAASRHRGGPLGHPLAEQHLEQTLFDALLLAASHNFTEALSSHYPAVGPRPVARAVELLRSSPGRAWTVSALAAEISVSVRSLQNGFRTTLGVSPMTYLRQVRLERVHVELAAADPATVTVATVAGRWGFVHLGRFAQAYRDRYIECPSDTLRAADLRASDLALTRSRGRARPGSRHAR
jgi:AraC-like DNA-binding protein